MQVENEWLNILLKSLQVRKKPPPPPQRAVHKELRCETKNYFKGINVDVTVTRILQIDILAHCLSFLSPLACIFSGGLGFKDL